MMTMMMMMMIGFETRIFPEPKNLGNLAILFSPKPGFSRLETDQIVRVKLHNSCIF